MEHHQLGLTLRGALERLPHPHFHSTPASRDPRSSSNSSLAQGPGQSHIQQNPGFTKKLQIGRDGHSAHRGVLGIHLQQPSLVQGLTGICLSASKCHSTQRPRRSPTLVSWAFRLLPGHTFLQNLAGSYRDCPALGCAGGWQPLCTQSSHLTHRSSAEVRPKNVFPLQSHSILLNVTALNHAGSAGSHTERGHTSPSICAKATPGLEQQRAGWIYAG